MSTTNASQTIRHLWADPEWRAALLARRNNKRPDGGVGGSGIPGRMNLATFKRFRTQARFEATLTMKKLDKAGVLNDADDMAREALHTALEIMRLPIANKEKLAAANTVLTYTKAKPAQKTELTVSKAEEWLEAVTADAETNESSDSGA